MTTIKDVAKRAGVSVGTVSRVINGVQGVKPQNLERIEQAIRELDFRPNQNAKSLRGSKSHMVGIIVTEITGEFNRSLISEMEAAVVEQGYLLVILNSHQSPDLERSHIQLLWDKRVDAIAIIANGPENEDLLGQIRSAGTPVVFIDRPPQSSQCDAVFINKNLATQRLVQHLVDNGHTRIALATGPRELTSARARFEGYTMAMFENKLQIYNEYIHFGQFSSKFGEEIVDWYCSLPPEERPTSIISGSTNITYGILFRVVELGLAIPEDLSLVSFGQIHMERLLPYRVTYGSERSGDLGRIAAELLFNRMKDPLTPTQHIALENDFVVQGSVRDLKKNCTI